jgi:hypothetical protein
MPTLATGANHAADQDVPRCQPMPVAALLGWPDHPLTAGRPDQSADLGPLAGFVPVAHHLHPSAGLLKEQGTQRIPLIEPSSAA